MSYQEDFSSYYHKITHADVVKRRVITKPTVKPEIVPSKALSAVMFNHTSKTQLSDKSLEG